MSEPAPIAGDERMAEVVAAFLGALEAGGEPDRGAILAGQPDLADELRGFFEAHDQMRRLADRARFPGERPADFDDFELGEEIGRGGMGVVYRATQRSLGRVVALKLVMAGPWASRVDLQRFRNEAEAAARLDHPNIVPVYEVGESRGHRYLSMRFMEGGSLAARAEGGPSDPRQSAATAAAVARAVHHAHQRGVLHRDLKPSNILLDAEGRPAVSDFGLARSVEDVDALTITGAVVGSPPYMAPEQAAGRKAEVTTATDVYGLGAVLYALLTGRPPFRGDSVLETLDMVRDRAPTPPEAINRAVDRDLATVCLKCLEKDPLRRYPSAEALAEDLERWLDGLPIEARPVGRLERGRRWCRRNPGVAGLWATVVVLLVGTISALAVGLAAVAREQAATASALAATRREREAARAGAAEASSQRRRAEANMVKALDVLNRLFMRDDAEDPARRAGLTPRQNRLAEEAILFYEGLLAEVKADPSARLEEGTIYCYLANVLLKRGDVAGVESAYGKAAESYRIRAEADPSSWECWAHVGQAHNMLGQALVGLGKPEEASGSFDRALASYRRAAEVGAASPPALNYLAWFLATCPEGRLRDPAAAATLAERALGLDPRSGALWNTLGVALYRSGRWAESVKALGRATQYSSGGDAYDWFFLAMAHARLGERDTARDWYDRAVEWSDRNNPLDGELRRLREEARPLLDP